MTNPATVAAALNFFTAEARNFLPLKSTIVRSKIGDIKQSRCPLATAKAALRALRSRYAPSPVVPVAVVATTVEPVVAPQTDLGVTEELTCHEGPSTPLSLKQALVEPDVFTQGGVTVVEASLARERSWIDPAERRLIARMRKAVARGDRATFDRGVAALDYVGAHPVQSTAWRKAEHEFENCPPEPQISLLPGEVPAAGVLRCQTGPGGPLEAAETWHF